MRASEHLPESYNAAEWFVGRHVHEGRGDRVALALDEGDVTYAQLDLAVRRFASALIEAGIRDGDRVAILLPDTPALCFAFWGAIAAGAVAVPINPLLKPHEQRTILDDCGARVVVVDVAEPASTGGAGATNAERAIAVWTAAAVRDLTSSGPAVRSYARTHRDAAAFFLYSSGTTGEPKGVVHLQHDMWICCETYGRRVLGVTESDRCFSVAKLFFAYGLGNAQYFPLHVGASAILLSGRPTPEAVFEHLRRHRPTLFFGVPTAYANMLAVMGVDGSDAFRSVRACVSAGESLPRSVFERWRERTALEILDGIGTTEIGHIFLSNRAGACRPGSSGIPVPGYDVRLVDDDGADVPRGELGDLLVRGDSIMSGYWNKPEATQRTLRGEWIVTGDKYSQDEDGYFFHGGRTDDMLKVGGIWVSPVEVEGVIASHPAVLECAVVGETDSDGLVKAHAYVTLRSDADTATNLEAAIKDFAKSALAAYKCPRRVTVVSELPKTATGKTQRFRLRGAPGR
jgi:benzoate-CoA ligase family protein